MNVMPGVVFEAERPRETAEFWAALLEGELVGGDHDSGGYDGGRDRGGRDAGDDGRGSHVTGGYDGGGLRVRLPDGPTVRVVGATAGKPAKNRIHLDLASDGDGDGVARRGTQRAIVDRAIRLGAARIDIGQYAGRVPVPWQVLADPAGNEFCVLEPRGEYAASGVLAAVVIESPDPHRLAEFWSGATRWPIVRTDPELVSLRAPGGRGPWLELLSADPCPPVTPRCRLELTVPPGAPDTAGADTTATGDAATGDAATGNTATGNTAAGTAAVAPGAFAVEADRLCLLGATRRGAGRLVDPDGIVIDLAPGG
ncbi:hypothetical protein LY41_000588 [Prauserella halophila]|nr:hypothetical protein [Prauserella halophila]